MSTSPLSPTRRPRAPSLDVRPTADGPGGPSQAPRSASAPARTTFSAGRPSIPVGAVAAPSWARASAPAATGLQPAPLDDVPPAQWKRFDQILAADLHRNLQPSAGDTEAPVTDEAAAARLLACACDRARSLAGLHESRHSALLARQLPERVERAIERGVGSAEQHAWLRQAVPANARRLHLLSDPSVTRHQLAGALSFLPEFRGGPASADEAIARIFKFPQHRLTTHEAIDQRHEHDLRCIRIVADEGLIGPEAAAELEGALQRLVDRRHDDVQTQRPAREAQAERRNLARIVESNRFERCFVDRATQRLHPPSGQRPAPVSADDGARLLHELVQESFAGTGPLSTNDRRQAARALPGLLDGLDVLGIGSPAQRRSLRAALPEVLLRMRDDMPATTFL